ncbi:MAG: lipoate--protein ligase family protein [Planctomycetes bacterium]|nr:lipoate--protein ligase family protein [Planctomycetota bacterium]
MDKDILRILIDQRREGAENMGVDEAILESVNAGKSPVTLRFYGWREPTISLGYFQKYQEFAGQDQEIRNLALVRRQTGGGAILHDDELTYSLVVPLAGKEETEIENLYRLMHDAFTEALGKWSAAVRYRGNQGNSRTAAVNSQRGAFFCFARDHHLDLVIDQDKLLGSAQRRLKHAVLQHGSLILGSRFKQQTCAELKKAIGKDLALSELINPVIDRVGVKLGLRIEKGTLSPAEGERAESLRQKYASDTWNRRR